MASCMHQLEAFFSEKRLNLDVAMAIYYVDDSLASVSFRHRSRRAPSTGGVPIRELTRIAMVIILTVWLLNVNQRLAIDHRLLTKDLERKCARSDRVYSFATGTATVELEA